MILRIFFFTLCAGVLMTGAVSGETMRVVTKENALREECRFFAPIRVSLKYNDPVDIISREGDWFRASSKGIRGCIHRTAVQEKSVSLTGSPGGKPGSASQDEIALAGKGFNPQVENSYRRKNPSQNYTAVDRIESFRVSDENLLKFIREGKLQVP